MRFIHWLRAKLTRKFWTHCPHCHRTFGGHQAFAQHVKIDGKDYRYVCHRCAPKKK